MDILFQYVLDNYQLAGKKIDSSSKLYKTLINDLPKALKDFLNRDDYLIQGSMGKGYRTDFPWVSILNRNITTSTQEGLYIVYLFKSDMTGFYIGLSQGITNFDRNFGKNKYDYANIVTQYYRNELSDVKDFSSAKINLVSKKSTLGYGYEITTIINKYYASWKFNTDELQEDLIKMTKLYDLIYMHMGSKNYNNIIKNILFDDMSTLSGYKAISEMTLSLEEEPTYPRDDRKVLFEVKPFEEKSLKFKKITDPGNTKIDFLKKAKVDAFIGLEGEKLALTFELNRLKRMGLEDLIPKVKWVSSQNDVAGYDILSFDFNDDGKIIEIYIEVKTSLSSIDTDFYVSKNELETSRSKKTNYRIFRIYNVLSINPKYYIAKGAIDENFLLEPTTYRASYKWKVQ